MKVLMLHSPASLVAKGGLYIQVQKTAEALRSLGVEVVPASSLGEHPLGAFDLCHIFGANMATYHVGRELHRRGVPLVVSPIFFSLHSPGYLRLASRLQHLGGLFWSGVWTDYGFVAELCRWARAVLPNTKAEAKLLCDGFGILRDKISVVPNGVDDRFYGARPDAFRDRYQVDKFILYVGQLDEGRKNTLTLIRILHAIDAPAVIIGQSEDVKFAELCRVEAAKNPRLVLMEALPHDSDLLASAYAACDVFVLPSLFETPGLAALEAALAGAKIVITKHGGTEEYFSPWAEFVDPRSEQSILRGMQTALSKLRNEELREHVRRNFLWSEVGKKTLEAYQKALDLRGI